MDLDLLAGLLIRSESIIAVARGAAEFGPRALGHRSFLAATHSVELKERLKLGLLEMDQSCGAQKLILGAE